MIDKQEMQEAIAEVKLGDLESLSWYMRSLDMEPGLTQISAIDENLNVTMEPALIIRHKDAEKMLDLIRKMSVASFTDETERNDEHSN